MTTTIQARPTLYKGIRMRSRLEADYAACLDQESKQWEYEPECFANADGQWLPDFRIIHSFGPLLTEVKPAGPLQDLIPASVAYVEHADAYLKRMTAAWSSQPETALSLVFWQYAGPAYLTIFSPRQGAPWLALSDGSPVELLWIGMGQYDRLRERQQAPDEPASATRAARLQSAADYVAQNWSALIGPELAEHTVPGALADGQFTLYADSTAWATQARLLAAVVRDRLNTIYGPSAITRINVRRGPVS